MKRSEMNSTTNIKGKFKTILNQLGDALMFPLSFLAFAAFFLGLTYVFPSNWLIANIISGITTSLFSFFPYFAFISLINVYHNDKNETTIIKALIFLLSIIGFKMSIENYANIEISFSLFSAMISTVIFIYLDKINIYAWAWVLIGFIFSFILIPIYYSIDLLIIYIGNIINLIPIGLNAFFYGFVNRLLLPFGMHSIMIPTFAWTSVGGYAEIYKGSELIKTINGDSPIWMMMYTNGIKDFATSGEIFINGSTYTYQIFNSSVIGQYQEGFLPIIGIAFPMVALTYCYFNGMENGKVFLLGVVMTMFSGITETTEYFFILINPYLYLLNAFMVGLSFMFCNLLNVHVWLSTGWIFDILLFGIIPSIKHFDTNWYWIPVIGITIGIIYSSLFIIIDKYSKYELKNLSIG